MDAVTRISVSSHAKTTMLAFFALGTVVSNMTIADPGPTREVAERGIVSLAGLDVLTPEGFRIASRRIQQMADNLCRQNATLDAPGAPTCVRKAVADAHLKLDAVIQARREEQEAHAVA